MFLNSVVFFHLKKYKFQQFKPLVHSRFKLLIWCLSVVCGLFVSHAVSAESEYSLPKSSPLLNVSLDQNLRQKVAQMLILDLRYFCQDKAKGNCQEPLRYLPDELHNMLLQAPVGGVILFSENLLSSEQIVTLNYALKTAIGNTGLAPYIAIDQEGGRVSRLPQSAFIGFAGNMAIGATFAQKGTYYADKVGRIMAEQLTALGFNLNFAPVLDVNSNPDNPIINVRAYSQFPDTVAKLGAAYIRALQTGGVAAAAKHFPGHGDTYVDSHVGLPRVNHSEAMIHGLDLLPFKYVMAKTETTPDMIMTAHIQYPALDSTEFISKKGAKTVLPATLSQHILSEVLKKELAYKGLIITDALEMAAISQFLSPQQAVIKAFEAGADITLMPYRISTPEQAKAFLIWLDELTLAISAKPNLMAKVKSAYNKIKAHKERLAIKTLPLNTMLNEAKKVRNNMKEHRHVAMDLSADSFTQLKPNTDDKKLSVLRSASSVLAIMPDKLRCLGLQYALKQQGFLPANCVSRLSQSIPTNLANVDVLLIGDATPNLGFYESKAHESISPQARLNQFEQNKAVNLLVKRARNKKMTTVLLQLRTPYVKRTQMDAYDVILASYDYQVIHSVDAQHKEYYYSPAMHHLVASLSGQYIPRGTLPVVLTH